MGNTARDERLYRIRHSFAHVLAEAVLQVFPDAKLAIGPPIADGFYYDFDLPRSLTEDDLHDIEARMRGIVAGDWEFAHTSIGREAARELFSQQPYKLELIDALDPGDEITTYQQNEFIDLCRGPHVGGSGELSPDGFKLLSVAGAYWRGDEKRQMLQRIYGTAWENAKELRVHLQRLKEAGARDHRVLGKELDLFSTHDDGGPGLIYWHPRGARVRLQIEDYWREQHLRNGYELLYTPHIGKSDLWKRSGHLDYYQEGMFAPMQVDNADYYARPMNCPFHIMVYKSRQRSYRDLPCRWAELGTVYRYERSGVLHGLLRVRGFTQDDAHIFCTPDQVEDEIATVLRFSLEMWEAFGFEKVTAYLATQPEKSVGADEDWRSAEKSLRAGLDREGVEYHIDEGGGAFYGPKIDIKITDALKREWQMTTIQFDFNLPERFDMTFVAKDGRQVRPFMVHRALLGSLERFFGVLIEHYAGRFPLWLAPEQVRVLPVSEAQYEYARSVVERLRGAGLRAEVDTSDERLGAKIRRAHNWRVPYAGIIGETEAREGTLTLRKGDSSGGGGGGGKQQQQSYSIDEAVALLTNEVNERK